MRDAFSLSPKGFFQYVLLGRVQRLEIYHGRAIFYVVGWCPHEDCLRACFDGDVWDACAEDRGLLGADDVLLGLRSLGFLGRCLLLTPLSVVLVELVCVDIIIYIESYRFHE